MAIATNMKQGGMLAEQIDGFTGLTVEDIEKL